MMDFNRWKQLMQQLGLTENADTFQLLVNSYNEKHRYYHAAAHISSCLQYLDQCRQLAKYPAEVEVAIWFHDAIYKLRSSTNELESANWCREFLIANKVDEEVIVRIYQLIMVTCHNAMPGSNDEKLMVDIDLTILGAPENIYWKFELDVRREYKWVPRFIFRLKRKEILEGFLARERIYHHDFFFQKLDEQARVNLQAAIARL